MIDLNKSDWDFIILKKKINVDNLRKWYDVVISELSYLKFNFSTCSEYVKPSANNKFITDTNNYEWERKKTYIRLQNSWTLSWPIPRDIPLPPPWAANLNIFKELEKYYNDQGEIMKDFDYAEHTMLNQYIFGEWENLYNILKKYIYNPRITQHMPGQILDPHIDGYIARMHIPITEDSSKFYWGENWNREYKFEPGNIYIINSKIFHATANLGPVPRANILADLHESNIKDLLNLK